MEQRIVMATPLGIPGSSVWSKDFQKRHKKNCHAKPLGIPGSSVWSKDFHKETQEELSWQSLLVFPVVLYGAKTSTKRHKKNCHGNASWYSQ